jgi:hypothetical protein
MTKTFKVTSFSLEDGPETDKLLSEARVLAAKDGWTFSEFIRTAIAEYVKRHSPGNPQFDLIHWTEQVPMPETVRIPDPRPSCLHAHVEFVKVSKPRGRWDPAWYANETLERRCVKCGAIS